MYIVTVRGTHVSCSSSLWFLSRDSTPLRMSHTKLTKVGTGGRNCVVQPMNWYCFTVWQIVPLGEGGEGGGGGGRGGEGRGGGGRGERKAIKQLTLPHTYMYIYYTQEWKGLLHSRQEGCYTGYFTTTLALVSRILRQV